MCTFVWVKFEHPIFTQCFYDGYILLYYILVIPIHYESKCFDVISKSDCVYSVLTCGVKWLWH